LLSHGGTCRLRFLGKRVQIAVLSMAPSIVVGMR
jgi:hypothetical protein